DLPLPDYQPFDVNTDLAWTNQGDNWLYAHTQCHPRFMPISIGRSCPYRCTFCCHSEGPRYRSRSLDSAFTEIAALHERYRFNVLFIYDELFSVGRNKVREFCQRMRDEGYDFDWTCSLRVGDADRGLLADMKAAGCIFIGYGFESASPAVLNSMKKRVTVEEMRNAVLLTQEAGIGVQGNFIFGDPAETPGTIAETLRFYEEHCRDLMVSLHYIAPYPGSEIFRHCLDKGIIRGRPGYYQTVGSVSKSLVMNMTPMADAQLKLLVDPIIRDEQAGYKRAEADSCHPEGVAPCDERAETPRVNYDLKVTCPHCQARATYLYPLPGALGARKIEAPAVCPTCHKRFMIQVPTRLMGAIDDRQMPAEDEMCEVVSAETYLTPVLLEAHMGFNLVAFRGWIHALDQELGPLDLTAASEQELQRYELGGRYARARTVRQIKRTVAALREKLRVIRSWTSGQVERRPQAMQRDREPRVSVVLLDWSCRDSAHSIEYLNQQTIPRQHYELIWIEYYDRRWDQIERHNVQAIEQGCPRAVDQWFVLHMPREMYYFKHVMYNVGLCYARGDIVVICDSDAVFGPNFIKAVIDAFDRDPNIVLHMDEVRNFKTSHYPFNYPSIQEVMAGAGNLCQGKPYGLVDAVDPLHSRNYGACFAARREDLIAIGGSDEHIDYLGHCCGPYEMTFRLVNAGKREIWHDSEWLYHVWHPGIAGDDNYVGPHDGKMMSTTALEVLRTGRVEPLVENEFIRDMRSSGDHASLPLPIGQWVQRILHTDRAASWKVDFSKTKRRRLPGGGEDIFVHTRREPLTPTGLWRSLRNGLADVARRLWRLAVSLKRALWQPGVRRSTFIRPKPQAVRWPVFNVPAPGFRPVSSPSPSPDTSTVAPHISVVLPALRAWAARRCINRIATTSGGVDYEVVVVSPLDMASLLAGCEGYERLRFVLEETQQGSCLANTLGYQNARGRYVFAIADDHLLGQDCLRNLLAFMAEHESELFLAGARCYALSGPGEEHVVYGFYYPYTPCIRRDVVEAIGGFYDPYYKCYWGDPDLAMRVWHRGGRVALCPDAWVEFHNAQDAVDAESARRYGDHDYRAFVQRWHGLHGDRAAGAGFRDINVRNRRPLSGLPPEMCTRLVAHLARWDWRALRRELRGGRWFVTREYIPEVFDCAVFAKRLLPQSLRRELADWFSRQVVAMAVPATGGDDDRKTRLLARLAMHPMTAPAERQGVRLVAEGLTGFNIIHSDDRYYAWPQSAGGFAPSGRWPEGAISAPTMAEVLRQLAQAHGPADIPDWRKIQAIEEVLSREKWPRDDTGIRRVVEIPLSLRQEIAAGLAGVLCPPPRRSLPGRLVRRAVAFGVVAVLRLLVLCFRRHRGTGPHGRLGKLLRRVQLAGVDG
ncbi:MAG: radical SAM protein, partial [Phycisphaerae bacterium]|nr:radical SAM protein [Phycisphaerae bacterium]